MNTGDINSPGQRTRRRVLPPWNDFQWKSWKSYDSDPGYPSSRAGMPIL